MSLQLVLLRHGQSVWNVEQRFAGSSDVELTAEGIRQAQAAGRLLGELGYRFDLVYTSELQRARHTARETLAQLDSSGMEVRSTWRLNERNFGELEGLRFVEAARIHGDDWGQPWLWGKKPPGGESMEELAARLEPLLDQEIYPAVRAGLRVLAVAHGNTIRVFDELLRRGVGERLETVPPATPLVYRLVDDGGLLRVTDRQFLESAARVRS